LVVFGVIALAGMALGELTQAASAAPRRTCRVVNETQKRHFPPDSGQAFTAAIVAAMPGDQLVVIGTCTGSYTLDKNLSVTGISRKRFPTPTLDGNRTGTTLIVDSGVSTTITSLTIISGSSDGSLARGIENGGSVNVTDSTFTGSGVGIDNEGGSLAVANSMFSGDEGAGISISEGTATVANSTFSGSGGGIGSYLGTVSVTNSTFSSNAGNAIDVAFTSLAVANSLFSSNAGRGIYSDRNNVTVSNSTFLANEGGGIFTFGSSVTVADSTFSGNDAASGGGILNSGTIEEAEGTLTVTNSTFAGNAATSAGGAILNYASAVATVVDSTFSGNDAASGGGISNSGNIDQGEGTLTVTNGTFSGNAATVAGGAIDNTGSVTVANSILSANPGGNCGGTISDGGYNLEFTGSPGINTCGFADHALSADPKLGPLQDNGGPTQTIALNAGSPAIDAIPSAVNGCGTTVATDQRGVSRPQGEGCDIGAFEVEVTGALASTSASLPPETRISTAEAN
jgi:hypothetical protein